MAGPTEQSWCRLERKTVPATQVHSARVDMRITEDQREGQRDQHRKQDTEQATKLSREKLLSILSKVFLWEVILSLFPAGIPVPCLTQGRDRLS